MIKNFLLPFSLYLAGVGAAAQVSKMVASQDSLMDQYGMGPSAVTIFITLIGLISIVLGSAAGSLVSRVGLTCTLIWACGCSMLIAILLPMTSQANVAFAARIIEGLGHLAIVTAAPALLDKYVDKRLKPFMMGLWSTFFGVAFAVSFAIYPYFNANGHELFQQLHAVYFLPATLLLIFKAPKAPEIPRSSLSIRMLPDLKGLPQILLSLAFMIHVGINTSMLVFASRMVGEFTTVTADSRQNVLALYPLLSLGASFAGAYFIGKFGSYLVLVISASLGIATCLATVWTHSHGIFLFGALFCIVGVLQAALFGQIQDVGQSNEDIAELNGMFAQFGNFGNLWIPYSISLIVSAFNVTWLNLLIPVGFAALLLLQLHPKLRFAKVRQQKMMV